MPIKTILPLYLTTHFLLSNFTVHPASVCTRIPKKEAMDNSGTMCPVSIVGRPGIMMSHMCVDITRRPSANATLSRHVVCCLLWTGVLSMTKVWVVPESAIASFNAIVIQRTPILMSALEQQSKLAVETEMRFRFCCHTSSAVLNQPRRMPLKSLRWNLMRHLK
jgi:hypothetical protein